MKKYLSFIVGCLCLFGLSALSTRHAINDYGVANSNNAYVLAQTGTTGGTNGEVICGGVSCGSIGCICDGTSCVTISSWLSSTRQPHCTNSYLSVRASEKTLYVCDGSGSGSCQAGITVKTWNCFDAPCNYYNEGLITYTCY